MLILSCFGSYTWVFTVLSDWDFLPRVLKYLMCLAQGLLSAHSLLLLKSKVFSYLGTGDQTHAA